MFHAMAKSYKNTTAEVSLDNFKGCEALSARSYLKGSAEARKANSLKIVKETTQKQGAKK